MDRDLAGAVMADLLRGADPLDESYSPPDVFVNDLAPEVEIIAPGTGRLCWGSGRREMRRWR